MQTNPPDFVEQENNIERLTQSWLADFEAELEQNPDVHSFLRHCVIKDLKERVRVTEENGCLVVFVDEDHHEVNNESLAVWELLLERKQVEGLFIEYFSPELKYNSRKSPIFIKPILSAFFKMKRYKLRLFSANQVVKIARENQVQISTCDIANSWRYQLGYFLAYILSTLNLSLFLAQTFQEHQWISPTVSLAFSIYIAFKETLNLTAENTENSAFLKKIEHWIVTFEDARRHFVAKGIETKTKQTQQKRTEHGSPRPEFIVRYPKAHNNRIIQDLLYPIPIKKLAYRIIAPYLDFSIRTFVPYSDGEDVSAEEKRKYSGWKLLERIQFPFFDFAIEDRPRENT